MTKTEKKDKQWAIDYKKKVAKLKASINPKVWDKIYK
jgi:hypothetical protein